MVGKIVSTWKECVIYMRQEGTKTTDPGGLYEAWLMCDMEQSERDNKVRALRLAVKLGIHPSIKKP